MEIPIETLDRMAGESAAARGTCKLMELTVWIHPRLNAERHSDDFAVLPFVIAPLVAEAGRDHVYHQGIQLIALEDGPGLHFYLAFSDELDGCPANIPIRFRAKLIGRTPFILDELCQSLKAGTLLRLLNKADAEKRVLDDRIESLRTQSKALVTSGLFLMRLADGRRHHASDDGLQSPVPRPESASSLPT